eukprot:CAMPEP_0115865680 /NCGR_PEP_ID=MMETSP0287-20121206/19848_1 /TAXON_ID=412157 /ORGANISM="Chrysochromulina rotalis, Strain UIO044" /LENGTH=417 /DNA_ID=CAMNT_0003320203 /DNA_START=300 /DNA_END=1549 /DNA_ORIENTATION=-
MHQATPPPHASINACSSAQHTGSTLLLRVRATAVYSAPLACSGSDSAPISLGLKPVGRRLGVDDELDVQRWQSFVERVLHARDDLGLGRERVLLGALEDHLVVDLEEQRVAELPEHLGALHLEHRERHDVCRATLDRSVDRGALEVRDGRARAALDAFQQAVASHQRTRPAGAMRRPDGLLLPLQDLRPVRVPRLEHRLGLAHGDAPVLRETVDRLAVGDRKVERLGTAALGAEDVLEERRGRLALGVVPLQKHLAPLHGVSHVIEHAHRRPRVEAAAGPEGLEHRLALRHVREEAQLELAVVGDHQGVALLGAEGLADAILIFFERRLVLKVGRARREPASLCVEVEGAVDAGALVGVLLQRHDEVREHRVDRAHPHQRRDRLARARALRPTAELFVGRAIDGRLVKRPAREGLQR